MYPEAMWDQMLAAFLECLRYPTYRLELAFLENPGEDEAAQRHRHDEDEGERQRGHSRFHDPQSHDAPQLDDGEHVHAPCLHLKWRTGEVKEQKPKDIQASREADRGTSKAFKVC